MIERKSRCPYLWPCFLQYNGEVSKDNRGERRAKRQTLCPSHLIFNPTFLSGKKYTTGEKSLLLDLLGNVHHGVPEASAPIRSALRFLSRFASRLLSR